MKKGNAKNEFINLSGSQICREISREGTSINDMGQAIESIIDLVAGFRNAFLIEGLLLLGAAMGIGLVIVLIKAGWLQ